MSDNRRYLMISLQARSDSHDPLRFFEHLQVIHLYREKLWGAFGTTPGIQTAQFRDPSGLYRQLQDLQPAIIQGVEPFALLPLPFIAQILRYVERHNIPLVVVSLENIPFLRKYGPLVTALAAPLLRRYIRRAALLIAVNQGARHNFELFGAAPERIAGLMYGTWGIDTTEFAPAQSEPHQQNGQQPELILFAGRLVAEKGIFTLLEAFALLQTDFPQLQLRYAGDGPQRQRLSQAIAAAGLTTRVQLPGAVPAEQMPELMRQATILAAPSYATAGWAEQVGMVLLQALGCGLPVVATRSGSIAEFIQHEVSGLLVAEHSPGELAAALARLLRDPQLRRQLSQTGRQVALERYDARRNIRRAEMEIQARCQ